MAIALISYFVESVCDFFLFCLIGQQLKNQVCISYARIVKYTIL